MLVLITGLPGSGKSTLAREYARVYGAIHLNSDVVRRELDLMGDYSDAAKQKVYRALQERAQAYLSRNVLVLIDSTLFKQSLRDEYFELASAMNAPMRLIELQVDEELARERTNKKRPDSEADFEVYKKIKSLYEPIQEPHLVIQSGQRLRVQLEQMHQYLQAK
ncbi:MAG: ATP-binding protein [Saprospiraceae bacterium]